MEGNATRANPLAWTMTMIAFPVLIKGGEHAGNAELVTRCYCASNNHTNSVTRHSLSRHSFTRHSLHRASILTCQGLCEPTDY